MVPVPKELLLILEASSASMAPDAEVVKVLVAATGAAATGVAVLTEFFFPHEVKVARTIKAITNFFITSSYRRIRA
jgi:hypothetical protein